ncbi:hypothetical protein BJ170DRAFT_662798 [Xylariales sp. AK1849]|nr:hypothetical protein BJ170DRAFT_662798 [Xylariales sp. AK1849]
MPRTYITKLGRAVGRIRLGRTGATTHATRSYISTRASLPAFVVPRLGQDSFSTSSRFSQPISPDALKTAKPADLNVEEYHALADRYIDDLLVRYEEMQDAKGEIDVEYSAGVMTVKLPHGDYVINKQPPNKQIWLSSPLSGPKRYDWVVVSEDQNSKQDTATGGWIYLRDGTFLSELLREETGVVLDDSECSLE